MARRTAGIFAPIVPNGAREQRNLCGLMPRALVESLQQHVDAGNDARAHVTAL